MGRSSTRISLALAVLLSASACKDGDGDGAGTSAGAGPGSASAVDPAAPVHLVVSVDWEGAYFDPQALEALDRFRADNPGVPLTHLLNAAYFTKPGADAVPAIREMKRAVRGGDEAGLHVHLWRSLVESAGVTPRLDTSFLHHNGKLLEFDDDIGFDVDPDIYSAEELQAVFARARVLLESNGFALAPVFRAGGWIGSPKVLQAARAAGFTVDSSSTDADWLDGEESAVLRERVRQVWPKVTRTTQPFFVDTPAGRILEMPNSGALADYVTAEEMEAHVVSAAEMAARQPGRPVFVHLGFHAETAHLFAQQVTQALAGVRRRGIPVRFETLSAAAEAARAVLEGPAAPSAPPAAAAPSAPPAAATR